MVDKPKCKVCGAKHWLGEPHEGLPSMADVEKRQLERDGADAKRIREQRAADADMPATLAKALAEIDWLNARLSEALDECNALGPENDALKARIAELEGSPPVKPDKPAKPKPKREPSPGFDRAAYMREYRAKQKAKP